MTILLVILAIILATFLLTVLFGAPYVPSLRDSIENSFTKLYRLSSKDTLIDIGSGDGTVLRHAAKKGATAIGYEINPVLFLISKILCLRYPKAKVHLKNFMHVEFPPDTTVVYVFGVDHIMPKIYDKVHDFARTHNRSIYLISLGFEVENQKPLRRSKATFLYKVSPYRRSKSAFLYEVSP